MLNHFSKSYAAGIPVLPTVNRFKPTGNSAGPHHIRYRFTQVVFFAQFVIYLSRSSPAMLAWAAANRATGTRNGEQLT